ncbi:preprotein translocase subunit SecA [Helcococcus kunzii]|uniref:preprotein translocase subunit SecA n=1 Tax=Helcococcus kunzii TaxID=40091 RepID=UPI0021A51A85|nr:preprotein translocase subunit SecA [Helcococcus kunzii]MCT1796290.1 preprotein translocase subunit SecA [Helcococcus kunzii]MCT1989148.1 preprotein translocase subunit SecA [Helcococcus kunzii]
MALGFMKRLFKSFSEKEIQKIQPLVDEILKLEDQFAKLSDAELKNKTEEFKQRLKNGETLDDILVEAFATVREASWRVLNMKHYPVQLVGGIILHQGRISEMKTGEGKTLVATLPAYLNALEGKGVHIVTVNDYLAERDKDWMGKVYRFLGLEVGCILYGLTQKERQEAYNADITYATNNQLGFDYLRDNMEIYKEDTVQRGLHYAIVDEVDSILIDEARTPLIISGKGEESTDMYFKADTFVKNLEGRILDPEETEKNKLDLLLDEQKEETVDFVVDEKRKSATLTEVGTAKAEEYFGIENLSDAENMELVHHINQALKARNTMHIDIDYVVNEGEILIVDEFTGRIMQGRRYSDGLHQALEAKEGVAIKSEQKTLATITFQNFFRMYDKLSGMTGTAMTEKDEFAEIYNMDVIEAPTNRPIIRKDENDRVYVNEKAKFDAVVEEIKEASQTGQPVLVGTVSIEKSEYLSKLLKKQRIPHEVLNAKQHAREAEIVAQAGEFGKITIATNMAGRGTDIVLGGNPEYMAKKEMKKRGIEDYLIDEADGFAETDDEEILEARKLFTELKQEFKLKTDENAKKVLEAGGLLIIGTERHESRRIDNQLRGRSGRQGDPGKSRFYVSLEDDLMRLFGGQSLQKFTSFPEDEPIEAGILSSAIEKAQARVEGNNFATRKRVLEYDNVMNKQREVIYGERNAVLNGDDMKSNILSMMETLLNDTVDTFCNSSLSSDKWEIEGLKNYLAEICIPKDAWANIDITSTEKLKVDLLNIAKLIYDEKEARIGAEDMREMERVIMLKVVDQKWMDHIDAMDQLKQNIGARAIGNEDPVRAYANEGFEMFNELNNAIREDTIKYMFRIEPQSQIERQKVAKVESESAGAADEAPRQRIVDKKIGRNDPCPCGSGKKYKNCHGKNI